MAAKKRISGPSGKNVTPRYLVSLPDDERAAQVAHAQARGESWAEWARAALTEARVRQQARTKSKPE